MVQETDQNGCLETVETYRNHLANLIRLGVPKAKAWEWASTRKAFWHTANSFILTTTITTERLRKAGAYSLQTVTKRSDSKLKEPPYTERYVRWCGRSKREIIPFLLPDCQLWFVLL